MVDQYHYLYKKDEELRGDNDDGIVEYGNNFLNCKIIDSKQIKIYSHTYTCKYTNVFVFQFFIKISQNRDYIQTFCNDRRNPFHFACS